MHFISAMKKLNKKRRSKDKYNSDFMLNYKEKESIIISIILGFTIIFIPGIMLLIYSL